MNMNIHMKNILLFLCGNKHSAHKPMLLYTVEEEILFQESLRIILSFIKYS